jgi:hypothetical protein
MNKLTKVGLSALCGSLASVSAYAGTMEVLGGATATYTSNSTKDTGNPIGMNSALTFKGSGELDNGTAITLTITGADQGGYTSGSINLATPSLGTFNINSRTGGAGIGGYDDKMPTAWEESWGHGMSAGFDLQKGVASAMNVNWTSPSFMGTTLKVAVAPGGNKGAFSNDKAVGGVNTDKQSGYDLVLDMNPSFGTDVLSGLNVWVGGSSTEKEGKGGTNQNLGDHEEVNVGFTYAYGPVKVGVQRMAEFTGNESAGSVDFYKNLAFGISFNVNDNLSLSYGEFESQKNLVGSGSADKSVTAETQSFQVAYTMGGVSLKLAESEVTNASYTTASSNTHDGRTIALSLAF